MTTHDRPSVPFDRVVLVHGFGADIDAHWFGWLADEVPQTERVVLPDSGRPTANAWVPVVRDAIGTLEPTTAVVAHSLGCLTVVRAVQQLAGGEGDLGVFIAVAPFAEGLPPTGDPGLDAFAAGGLPHFLEGTRVELVRPRLGRVSVIRSDDDPLVPAAASDRFAELFGADRVVVPGAGHFLEVEGVTSLDPVVDLLRGSAS